ncbi:MAG: hypothetical protein WBD50_03045 [Candidatus Rhabdochlamydia sp.]
MSKVVRGIGTMIISNAKRLPLAKENHQSAKIKCFDLSLYKL